MQIRDPKELFMLLLSEARSGTERTAKFVQELSSVAQDPDVKEALEVRALMTEQDLAKLDEVFKLLGQQPVKLTGRVHDVFIEDFRKELSEIQSPAAKAIFIMAKANHLIHFRIAEYVALIAAADITGHHGVGALLESCLADKLAFVERTRRVIRRLAEAKVAGKIAEKLGDKAGDRAYA